MTPTSHTGIADRFEVDLRYGSFIVRQSDLRVEDVFDVPLTRSYNSAEWFARNKTHAFGVSSNHPFDVAPLGTRHPYTQMELALEDGDILAFRRISKGVDASDAVYLHNETSTRFYGSTIAWNGDGWTLRFSDGSTVKFPEAYKATRLAEGAATEMTDAAGGKLMLVRDSQRNLSHILTPHGRHIDFVYDRQARIVNASNDTGSSVEYVYNTDGMLSSVRSSVGGARHYEYQGSRMTAITDGHGRTLIRNIYTSNVLTCQVFEDGQILNYIYDWSGNRSYARSVTITSSDHTLQIIPTAESVPRFLRPS